MLLFPTAILRFRAKIHTHKRTLALRRYGTPTLGSCQALMSNSFRASVLPFIRVPVLLRSISSALPAIPRSRVPALPRFRLFWRFRRFWRTPCSPRTSHSPCPLFSLCYQRSPFSLRSPSALCSDPFSHFLLISDSACVPEKFYGRYRMWIYYSKGRPAGIVLNWKAVRVDIAICKSRT